MMRIPFEALAVGAIAAALGGASAMIGSAEQPQASISQGAELFKVHCASCHGTTGLGNGPVAAVLRHRPADLTLFEIMNGGTFPDVKIRRIIDGRDVAAHGTPEMPVWGSVFKSLPDHPTDEAVAAR